MEIFNTTAAMLASYNDMMSSINEAAQTQSKRAYGGFVRGVKGNGGRPLRTPLSSWLGKN